MRLVVRHQTIYRYGSGSSRVAMLLKLWPSEHEGQRVESWSVTVNDEPVAQFVPNGHGDKDVLWIRHDRMDEANIVASGVVDTRDTAGVMTGLPQGADPLCYLRATPLTPVSAPMREALAALEHADDLARLHALSQLVRDRVAYRAGVTVAGTSAAEAFDLGAGVCQDHAQIFIAMARSMGIPARYVSGYLLADDDAGALHETHAWAEARVPALGWVGFDVSNGLCVTERYIRLAAGLDAHDAAPVRGNAVAAGAITVDADVRIDDSELSGGDARIQQLQEQQQQQ
ncbi:transglutaminase domain-containing protein [Sphingobium subterraneum]|uniref:Transglutaminase-like putative cysteine protease n=1 Tax=Sphingobium subterraneum TaxID=627688 RepID=A0A841IV30_9SPHN|nr:transglutaminase-like putative cysteine protease [Sphingobium subterraneum]